MQSGGSPGPELINNAFPTHAAHNKHFGTEYHTNCG